jgi:hypothetical protein
VAFESLSDKLQNVFKNLRSKGRLTEADVKAALKEVKMALLEADVSFKVVKQFISSVQERAVGQDVMTSLTPGQMVIKIVNEEMVKLMGSETTELKLKPGNEITVIMMMGLQGAGKTTTAAKLAKLLKENGKKPMVVSVDVHRPAAAQQLKVLSDAVGVDCYIDPEEKDAVKAAVLKILKDEYDIDEDDFVSAEIEAVPAGKAREAGFDRSMIVGYGHDDRCCAYPSAAAMLDVDAPKTTSCGLFVDKEEIGSVGATGMESHFFEDMMREVLDRMGIYSELNLVRCLRNSRMLSSDVSAAYDPLFADRFEKKNSAKFGHGLAFNKYTGARGKSGANDANAEYLAMIRQMLDKHDVVYQTAELGKVDAGGGGTIAYILSLYGMQVVDCGVAILSMHAPWETLSKSDLYEAYKGYKAFLIEG